MVHAKIDVYMNERRVIERTHQQTQRETAGQLLIAAVPTVATDATVAAARATVFDCVEEYESINYCYVLDEAGRLRGVLSIRELCSAPVSDPVVRHATSTLVTVSPDTDQELVARLALRHNIKAVPVCNEAGTFLGVVTSDAILRVLDQEHTEDVLYLAGVNRDAHPGSVSRSRWLLQHVSARLPWLVLGLGGGLLAAGVVGYFEETLADQLLLAAFIPAVVYMADAVGGQAQLLFIRILTLHPQISVWRYVAREWSINTVVGALLSGLLYVVSLAWWHSSELSAILAIAVFLTVYFSVAVAIFLPWIFTRLDYDPALASGPLATVIRDISSLCIYLAVAQLWI